tara:strand:+ start:130 stop:936 length:807 start_codon:yes stop_codon:yes gene_type:complete
MNKLLLILISVVVGSCDFQSNRSKDCLSESDDINRSSRPTTINPLPTDFEDAIRILDTVLTNDEKLVIKCSNEEELELRTPFPEIWMWSVNKYRLCDETSPIGQILADEGIYKFSGDQILAILYHRHLNEKELKLEETLKTFRIRNQTKARVTNLKIYESLTKNEFETIVRLSNLVDSSFTASARPDIKTLVISGNLPENRKEFIQNRNLIIHFAKEIRKDLNNKRSFKKNLEKLKEITKLKILDQYEQLSTGEQLIVLEEVKLMTIK